MDILNRLQPGSVDEAAFGEDHLEDSPFIVIRRGKRKLSTRRGGQSAEAKEGESQVEEDVFDDLCFQGVGGSATRRGQNKAGDTVNNTVRGVDFDGFLDRLEESVKLNMQHADEHVFEGVLNLAKRSARRHASDFDSTILTGLVFAGGVNSADHSRIFPALKEYLETRGCRVALLSPLAFTGKTLSFTLGKVLDQMRKEGEDISDLLDEDKDYLTMDDMVGWYGKYATGKKGRDAQPLVIIVESVETTRSEALQDFIHVLHERYSSVPHLLLLGLTTTSETLADALPHRYIDRCLACYNFDLAPAMMQLESFVENVLVKNWNGLLFHFRSFHFLLDTFFLHHFTVSTIYRGMKLAVADALVNHPCPSLVYASLGSKESFRSHVCSLSAEEMDAVWNALYNSVGRDKIDEVLADLKDGPSRTRKKKSNHDGSDDFFMLYCDFRKAWESWRFAFELLTNAGKAVEASSLFSCWRNYESALSGDFATAKLPQLLDDLRIKLSSLDDGYINMLQKGIEDLFGKGFEKSDWCPAEAVEMIETLQAALRKTGPIGNDQLEEDRNAHNASAKSRRSNTMDRGNKSSKSTTQSDATGEFPKGEPFQLALTWTNTLCQFFEDNLVTSPLDHPVAHLFTCALESNSLSEYLVASTRKKIHRALRHPKIFYPDKVSGLSTETNPLQEDTCIAYTLLDEDPLCSNLVDWYLSFEEFVEGGRKAGGEEAGKEDRSAKRECIARFSQSLQDLQFIGMIQSSKRRKGDHAQRSIYQPSLDL